MDAVTGFPEQVEYLKENEEFYCSVHLNVCCVGGPEHCNVGIYWILPPTYLRRDSWSCYKCSTVQSGCWSVCPLPQSALTKLISCNSFNTWCLYESIHLILSSISVAPANLADLPTASETPVTGHRQHCDGSGSSYYCSAENHSSTAPRAESCFHSTWAENIIWQSKSWFAFSEAEENWFWNIGFYFSPILTLSLVSELTYVVRMW